MDCGKKRTWNRADAYPRRSLFERASALGHGARQQARRNLHNWNYALISHARRADDAYGADHFAVGLIRRGHDAALIQRYQAGLAADIDLHTVRAAAHLQKLQQAGALLEQIEQAP